MRLLRRRDGDGTRTHFARVWYGLGLVTTGSRSAQRRQRVVSKLAAALLIVMALGPLASAVAALADAVPCCRSTGGQLAAPPTPCQWIAATSCCDSASALASVPQPTPPPAILFAAANFAWNVGPAVIGSHELHRSPPERLGRSTIVLLL